MQFDFQDLPENKRYKLMSSTITPRPIAWVTTRSAAGVNNASPFSFFNMMGADPPVLAIGVMRRPNRVFKDTAANILETGEFVVNLVSRDVAQAMNATSTDAPPGVDELALAGLETVASVRVAPPRIAASPVSFECRNLSSMMVGPKQLIVLGEVLMAHIRDDLVLDAERCYVDTPSLDLIARMHGGGWYTHTPQWMEMDRPVYPKDDAKNGDLSA
jgi:flavin reductase (DIM6/NTAB) family NADH-FMN oxidoreductase RutF